MKIRWTKNALNELFEIGDYISRDNKVAAKKLLSTIRKRVANIRDFPNSGRTVPEFENKDIREIIEKNYRIVYRISGDTAFVLTVFESHRLFPHHAMNTDSK